MGGYSTDSGSMVGMLDRLGILDRMGKTGTGNAEFFFDDVSHNRHSHNHSHHHLCNLDNRHIVRNFA